MSISTPPFEFFDAPYAHTKSDLGIRCNEFPKLDFPIVKWTTCAASKAWNGNPAEKLCKCKGEVNHESACQFLQPLFKLVACMYDWKPMFTCRAKEGATEKNMWLPLFPKDLTPFDGDAPNAYDLRLDTIVPNSIEELSHNDKRTISLLFDANIQNYVHNINTACTSEEESLKRMKLVSGHATPLPNWKLEKQYRPRLFGKADKRLVFPMGQIYSREVGEGISLLFMTRGTNTMADIMADIDINLVYGPTEVRGVPLYDGATDMPEGGANIHRGFYRYGKIFGDKVLAFLLDEMEAPADGKIVDRVMVTGHSLGGFVSQVVGFYLNVALHALARHNMLPAHVSPNMQVDVVSLSAGVAGDVGFASIINNGLPSIGLPKVNIRVLQYDLDPVINVPCEEKMPQCDGDSWLPGDDPDARALPAGLVQYGRLNGSVRIKKRDGIDRKHLAPGKNLYTMRFHVCAYKCGISNWSGVKSEYCTYKACKRMDFSNGGGAKHEEDPIFPPELTGQHEVTLSEAEVARLSAEGVFSPEDTSLFTHEEQEEQREIDLAEYFEQFERIQERYRLAQEDEERYGEVFNPPLNGQKEADLVREQELGAALDTITHPLKPLRKLGGLVLTASKEAALLELVNAVHGGMMHDPKVFRQFLHAMHAEVGDEEEEEEEEEEQTIRM